LLYDMIKLYWLNLTCLLSPPSLPRKAAAEAEALMPT